MKVDSDWLREIVRQYDFDGLAIVKVHSPPRTFSYFDYWIEQGFYGTMTYLPRGRVKRENPLRILPNANSWIVIYKHYQVPKFDLSQLTSPAYGRIAAYAQSVDYHFTIGDSLKEIASKIDTIYNSNSKVYVDTGPILERDLFLSNGNGFWGKNSCAILPRGGSFFFIGEILSTAEFTETSEEKFSTASCGSCFRCQEICPTNAIVSPNVLDARKCISYLTIEFKGDIPIHLRSKMKNWLFGCDDCQTCCPWNKFHPKDKTTTQIEDRFHPFLLDLIFLDENKFREMYTNTPVLRIGRNGFLRNVAIALSNWGSTEAKSGLDVLLRDTSALVREHARWGLEQKKDWS